MTDRSYRPSSAAEQLTRGCAGAVALVLTSNLVAACAAGSHWWLLAAVGALLILAATRPVEALLVLVGLGPVAGALTALSGSPLPLLRVILLTCLTGWCTRRALAQNDLRLPVEVRYPLLTLALLVAASGWVAAAAQQTLLGTQATLDAVHAYSMGSYVGGNRVFSPVDDAFTLLAHLAVFGFTAAICSRHRDDVGRIARMAAFGACAAAILNIVRLVVAAVASPEPLSHFVHLANTIRINTQFFDVNAAGSYFALMVCVGTGALISTGHRVSAIAGFATITLAATWLTGSRAAVGAVLCVALFWVLRLPTLKQRRTQLVAVWAAGALAFVILFPNPIAGAAASTAVRIRVEMAKVAAAMIRSDPAFGVGIGGFFDASEPFIAQTRLRGVYARENAHNNLLQIAAELGLTGALAFGWLLWRSVRRRSGTAGTWEPLDLGLIGGLIAFGLTALLGHPLLTAEVSLAFWIIVGITAGRLQPGAAPSAPVDRSVGWTVVAIILLTLTYRVDRAVGRLDLEHIRHGFTRWEQGAEGIRYQEFEQQGTLFIGEETTLVRMPVQFAGTGSASLEISIDDRVVNVVTITEGWLTVPIQLPSVPERGRFFRLDLRVMPNGSAEPASVRVGRLVSTPRQRRP